MSQQRDQSVTALRVCVSTDKAGMRLDRFLTHSIAEKIDGLSRNRIQGLLAGGCVRLGDRVVSEAKKKVTEGDVYEVSVPPPEPAEPEPQDIPLDILYEDDDLVVLNKPAGLVVHPAPGNLDRTLVNALLAHCGDSLSGIGGVARPGIVHRLDKDTSGVMVVAKNEAAHVSLSGQFAAHSVERAYRALVWGVPSTMAGRIEGNIGRSTKNRKKMAILVKGGKPAATNYRVLRAFGITAAMVECRLETGRTHQIRVHMASIGHPVMGDPLYGGTARRLRGMEDRLKEALKRYNYQALHAILLGFKHPKTGKMQRFKVNLPININELTNILENL